MKRILFILAAVVALVACSVDYVEYTVTYSVDTLTPCTVEFSVGGSEIQTVPDVIGHWETSFIETTAPYYDQYHTWKHTLCAYGATGTLKIIIDEKEVTQENTPCDCAPCLSFQTVIE